jgi:hypothetical protein
MSAAFYWQQPESCTLRVRSLSCPRCEFLLTIHQPDPELPDRLLATCQGCEAWFLADSEQLTSGALTGCSATRESPGLTRYLVGGPGVDRIEELTVKLPSACCRSFFPDNAFASACT